jgi:hypothetical protein
LKAQPEVRPEPTWPATLAILVILILQLTLLHRLTVGPNWLEPVLEVLILIPVTVRAPLRLRLRDEAGERRGLAIALLALINAANLVSLALLVRSLLAGSKASGVALIYDALKLWLTNIIVFGLWFWELDRGGLAARSQDVDLPPDFAFPQTITPGLAGPGWRPSFLDYLYVSFTNATAFSPTDTMPLSPWAKTLMAVEALISLLTIALVAARAVNILP